MEKKEILLKSENKKPERHYYLDLLRFTGVFLVCIYHMLRVFAKYNRAYVSNNELSMKFDLIILALASFGMPLFFIISGKSTFYALKHVGGKKFTLARILRLLVPYIVGITTFVPLMLFLSYTQYHEVTISEYFVIYFRDFATVPENSVNMLWFGSQMWYLVILLVLTLLTTPVLVWLAKEKNQKRIGKAGKFFQKPGTLYLLLLPLIAIELSVNPIVKYIPRFTGFHVFTYLFFLIYGFLFAHKEFEKALEKHALPSVFIALVAGIVGIPIYFVNSGNPVAFLFLGICCWSTLIATFHYSKKYLNKKNKITKILRDITLPFYLLHELFVVIFSLLIVKLNLPILVKLLLLIVIVTISTISTSLLISKFNLLRFFFGMRIRKKTVANYGLSFEIPKTNLKLKQTTQKLGD